MSCVYMGERILLVTCFFMGLTMSFSVEGKDVRVWVPFVKTIASS